MANDHCCTNDKRNESGKDLSFFNFPSNKSQRSQWIASIKGDEGPLFFFVLFPQKRNGIDRFHCPL